MKTLVTHAPSGTSDGVHGRPLRSGYTTGACATAAAKGAALMLVHQVTVREVTIELPAGLSATFKLSGQNYTAHSASCFVIKDAGDDPDITNGAEVHATVSRGPDSASASAGRIIIEGGKGIGRVTKPGLAVPPGEWAINPVPRQMIEAAAGGVLSTLTPHNSTFKVVVSIPDGEERSKKTLNARLGIIGGLSILGTTGIVRPISAKAWMRGSKTRLVRSATSSGESSFCTTNPLKCCRIERLRHWLDTRALRVPPKRASLGAPVSSLFRLDGAKFCKA